MLFSRASAPNITASSVPQQIQAGCFHARETPASSNRGDRLAQEETSVDADLTCCPVSAASASSPPCSHLYPEVTPSSLYHPSFPTASAVCHRPRVRKCLQYVFAKVTLDRVEGIFAWVRHSEVGKCAASEPHCRTRRVSSLPRMATCAIGEMNGI